jgi:hypothetical protein
VAKPEIKPTTPAAGAAPDNDDFTPPGVDPGPFDIPADWLSLEGRTRLVEQFKAAEREAAELAKARAIIDNYLNTPTRVVIVKPKPTLTSVAQYKVGSQKWCTWKALLEAYPETGGKVPTGLKYKTVERKLVPIFRDRKWKLPHRRVIESVMADMGRS